MMVEYAGGSKVNAAGTNVLNPGTPGEWPPARQVWFDYSATQIYVGTLMDFVVAADPRDGFVMGPGYDVIVTAAATGVGKARLAGVVEDLGQTNGTEDGWITIRSLVPNQVYTFAVAVNLGEGDGLKMVNGQAYCDDSGAYAVTDCAIALYDENDANNPHGVDAISASIGLVEAVWTGYDLQDTA